MNLTNGNNRTILYSFLFIINYYTFVSEDSGSVELIVHIMTITGICNSIAVK